MDETHASDDRQTPADESRDRLHDEIRDLTDAILDRSDETGMSLLRAGVPLSLLIDLAFPEGPDSRDLFEHETKPDSVWHRPA